MIEMYTSDYCFYCKRAKALFDQLGVDVTEINIQHDAGLKEKMINRANGLRTVPQIFINNIHIGGCDELYHLHQQGELESLLKGDQT
ncbi:glutaredoxin 3 [Gammaproteobacteria bacterium]|nr:glutaredoxin 3 [Gammaproteobacteria bacterium]